jgi:hypothetical protein
MNLNTSLRILAKKHIIENKIAATFLRKHTIENKIAATFLRS